VIITSELTGESTVPLTDHSLDLLNTDEASQCLFLLVVWVGGRLMHALQHTHCLFGIIMQLISLTHSQF